MRLRGKVSLCRACGEVFTTVNTFDRHRTGKGDIHASGHGRRCLTPAELSESGYAKNAHGRWHKVNTRLARAYAIQGEAITVDPLPSKGVGP